MEKNLELIPTKQKNWFHGYISGICINIITIPDISNIPVRIWGHQNLWYLKSLLGRLKLSLLLWHLNPAIFHYSPCNRNNIQCVESERYDKQVKLKVEHAPISSARKKCSSELWYPPRRWKYHPPQNPVICLTSDRFYHVISMPSPISGTHRRLRLRIGTKIPFRLLLDRISSFLWTNGKPISSSRCPATNWSPQRKGFG